MTHDEACQAVAWWMRRQRWCSVAATEIAGAVYAPEVEYPIWDGLGETFGQYKAESMAAMNASIARSQDGGGQLDVIGFSRPQSPRPRVCIAEIKVSRSDLLADLRKRKMLRYESQATHCYLAVTAAVVGRRTLDDLLAELPRLGLPVQWGLLDIRGQHDVRSVSAARPLRARGLDVTDERLRELAWRVARSCSYRLSSMTIDMHRRATCTRSE